MTWSRQERHKLRARQMIEDRARQEGRLIEKTGRCGPWIVTNVGEQNERHECRCGEVSYPWEIEP